MPRSEYKKGLGDSYYREVPKGYRKLALLGSPEARVRKRKSRGPNNQMTIDLLEGKTLFAYDPFFEEGQHRNAHGQLFQTVYNTARRYGKIFRCVGYDMPEDGHYRGYIMWLETEKEGENLLRSVERQLGEFIEEDKNAVSM